MNAVLTKILATKQVTKADGTCAPLHSHIPHFECEIIQQWLQAYGCSRVIEIGLAYGISSLFICDAVAQQHNLIYHIIDPYQQRDWSGIGLYNLAAAGYGACVEFHEEPAESCLRRLWQAGFRCDFALIDGDHTFEKVFGDFFWINQLLVMGGLVVFDDIQLPAIQQVVDYVQHLPGYQPLPLPADSLNSTTARVRRMAGVPAARVVGFIKTPNPRDGQVLDGL
jgi:predicted O-methyltransferase YrrM